MQERNKWNRKFLMLLWNKINHTQEERKKLQHHWKNPPTKSVHRYRYIAKLWWTEIWKYYIHIIYKAMLFSSEWFLNTDAWSYHRYNIYNMFSAEICISKNVKGWPGADCYSFSRPRSNTRRCFYRFSLAYPTIFQMNKNAKNNILCFQATRYRVFNCIQLITRKKLKRLFYFNFFYF